MSVHIRKRFVGIVVETNHPCHFQMSFASQDSATLYLTVRGMCVAAYAARGSSDANTPRID